MPPARVMFWKVTMSARLSFALLRETYPYDENGNVCPAEAIKYRVSHYGLRCRRTVVQPGLRDWATESSEAKTVLISLGHRDSRGRNIDCRPPMCQTYPDCSGMEKSQIRPMLVLGSPVILRG